VNLVDELQAIAGALERAHVPYALCGGIAVTVHGATRTTKGIDLLVRRAELPRILDVIRPLGFTFAALPMTFEAARRASATFSADIEWLEADGED
jgi:hypothetical protein